ncbi:MAG TPA: energy-dependent translational throttle protein EttA [Vicinamibacterales bacterium]|jgi:ATP-binding cassette ChvD family protein|nr:energy-dependent translational throttle protein EttA [Vicinamibacterales bacterium]
MPQFIYTMKGLGKVHQPDHVVLKDIWLSFLPGAKIGVLGLNGSGKSTLLRIMAGEDTQFVGEAFPAAGITIGFLPQEPRLDAAKTVLGNVEEGVSEVRALLDRYDAINARFGEELSPDEMDKVLEEQGRVQDRIEAANGWDLDSRLELAMDALRLPPPDADVTTLSGGERRRVALCRLLLRSPDLLLLDEPTNHLDAESVAWLERFLKDYPGTVVAVTHDRYFLDNVAGWILELDRGSGIPWEGNYSSWLAQKQQRLQLEEKQESKRQRTLQRELDWIRMSPRARQAKGKARLNAYEDLLKEESAQRIEQVEIYIPPGPRLGDLVVEARGLRKSYGDLLLMDDVDFTLPRGGIVGVIGPNGAGKTTLFRMMTGQEQPDAGSLRLGETVQIGYVDQSRDALGADRSVWEEISGGNDEIELGKRAVASRAYVSWFNFKGRDQQRKVGQLSGGERNRVHLAKLLQRGSNLLLLDEPTNDLDVDTLRALEEALLSFAGCAVVISHDRWFLDRIATHMLAFEGDSKVVWFQGNYEDYEADRKRRLGAEADQPHRIKYRKLTR